MKNLSELIDKHEEIFGDQSLRITSLPTMTELRMTEDEKKKKQQKEWYANNKVQQIDKAKKWNKANKGARKLITERYKQKGQECQWTSKNHR